MEMGIFGTDRWMDGQTDGQTVPRVLASIEKLSIQMHRNDVFTSLRWPKEGHTLISGTQLSRIGIVQDGVAS